MPKGNSNDVGVERLEQTIEQFLGKGLKKLVANFSDVQYINTVWNVSGFKTIGSGYSM
jgi:hypothetical protein